MRCIRRQGTPGACTTSSCSWTARSQEAICERYRAAGWARSGRSRASTCAAQIAMQRFLGYDYVPLRPGGLGDARSTRTRASRIRPTLARSAGAQYMDEHRGPITTWEEFEAYPWPDPARPRPRAGMVRANLPDDMCVIGSGGFGHFAEYLPGSWATRRSATRSTTSATWWPPSPSGCIEMIDAGVADGSCSSTASRSIWGSDDMGFKTGPLISPDDLREFVLPGHQAHGRDVARRGPALPAALVRQPRRRSWTT